MLSSSQYESVWVSPLTPKVVPMDGWNLKLYHQARSLFIIFLMTDKQAALSCDDIQFIENILNWIKCQRFSTSPSEAHCMSSWWLRAELHKWQAAAQLVPAQLEKYGFYHLKLVDQERRRKAFIHYPSTSESKDEKHSPVTFTLKLPFFEQES